MRNHEDESQFMNAQERENSQGEHRLRSKGTWPVFAERVDLELRSGAHVPVHPLGAHLRAPQHDEKSEAALREFVTQRKSVRDGLQFDANNKNYGVKFEGQLMRFHRNA